MLAINSRRRLSALLLVPGVLAFAALIHGACGGGGGGGGSGSGSSTGPVADFTATPTTGTKPLDVQFTNTTSGNASDWLWDFGDGSISTERDPLHGYAHAGSFTVQLIATGPGGFTTRVRNNFIGVSAPLLDSSFESQTAGAAPGSPWDVFFGTQGNIGLVMNSAAGGPDVGMPTDGQLWVELGGDSTDNTLPPNAGPGATPRTGAGLAQEITFPAGKSVLQFDVLFVNGEAIGAALTNDWMSADISDGNTSITLLRRDTFSATSNHSTLHGGHRTTALETVTADLEQLFPGSNFLTGFTLSVQTGNGGNATLPSQVYLDRLRFEVPQPALNVQFLASATQINTGGQVSFTDQTIGGSSWVWDFGDGKGSNEQHPVHVYTQAGLYDVSLHVSAPGTQGELVKADLITVLAPTGTLDFVGQPTTVALNAPVLLTNLSNGNFNNTWLWEFGDGQTSPASGFGTPVSHSYTTLGKKSVRLTGTLTNGVPLALLKTDYIDVQTPVSISSHPANVTVNLGQTANFTVVANGTPPLTFQWRRNGATIPGAPNLPNYTTPPTTAQDNGAKYRVRVSNALNSVQSNEAILTVIIPPVIAVQPAPTTVPVGVQAVFNVTLQAGTGSPPLTFAWRKNGVAIPGAPNLPSFTTAPVTPSNNGEKYSVRISNAAGFVVSSEALLTVSALPVLTGPFNQTTCVGSTAQFSVSATGTAPFTFQWRKNAVNIPGATNSAFTTPPAVIGDNGALFSVVVSNVAGSTTSGNASLTVNSPPAIAPGGQPANKTVCSGNTALFSVTATGGGLSFQWRKNGNAIPGATNSSFTTPATVPADNGALFSCFISSACGNVTSNNAVLTVNTSPSITVQPQATFFVVEGASKQFSVSASGTAPLSFQWRKNAVNIPGATANSFTTSPAVFTDDGTQFTCVVSNGCGSATSNVGTLQVAKKWSTIWAASINPGCIGCHGAAGSAGLTLSGSASAAHTNTVNVGTGGNNGCAGSLRINAGNLLDPLHNQGNPADSIFNNILSSFPACISQDHRGFLNATQKLEILECITAGIPNT